LEVKYRLEVYRMVVLYLADCQLNDWVIKVQEIARADCLRTEGIARSVCRYKGHDWSVVILWDPDIALRIT
jgi:hypothetical protein